MLSESKELGLGLELAIGFSRFGVGLCRKWLMHWCYYMQFASSASRIANSLAASFAEGCKTSSRAASNIACVSLSACGNP